MALRAAEKEKTRETNDAYRRPADPNRAGLASMCNSSIRFPRAHSPRSIAIETAPELCLKREFPAERTSSRATSCVGGRWSRDGKWSNRPTVKNRGLWSESAARREVSVRRNTAEPGGWVATEKPVCTRAPGKKQSEGPAFVFSPDPHLKAGSIVLPNKACAPSLDLSRRRGSESVKFSSLP